ncbi:uncharacterized protein LOC124254503 [Haliotis rubra]|uniref:uncharacterized protein LOC124254503 n=1 Tax=Haliotis rubra TaxID=36100 RepID=UPI001EE5BC05|nr:uncharacterized protein LOC124254503 [Haliotis rubra]
MPTGMCRLLVLGLLWGGYACLVYSSEECPIGTYRDFGSGNCDPCSDICQGMNIKGTKDDCRKHCPDAYTLKLASESKVGNKDLTKKTTGDEGSILPVVLPVFAAVVVVSVVVGIVVYRRRRVSRRHTPVQPVHDDTLVELPSIQCTEESDSSFHVVPIEEQQLPLPVEEDTKFPTAFSDLPYSARYDTTQQGSY